MKTENLNSTVENQKGAGGSWLNVVRDQVSTLGFGVVQIVVHAARVVQIERTEKIRFETPLQSPTYKSNFARQTSGGRTAITADDQNKLENAAT